MNINSSREKLAKHPFLRANFLSRITFFYIKDVFKKYFSKNFTDENLYETLPNLSSQTVGNKFENIWRENLKKDRNSVLKLLLSYMGKKFWIYTFFYILLRLLRTYLQPFLIGKIIRHFSSNRDESSFNYAISAATASIIFHLIVNLVTQNYFFIVHKLGLQIAVGLSSLIYRKSLRLKSSAKIFNANGEAGNIVTMITKDVLIFDNVIDYISVLTYFFICFLMAAFLICQKLGIVGLTTVVVILTMILFQLILSKKIYNQRIKVALQTAARLEIIREVLSTIRIIKMYSWESFFMQKINSARKKEMKGIYILYIFKFLAFTVGTICSSSNFYILFIVYVSVYGSFPTDTLFYIMILLGDLKHYITISIPIGLPGFGEMFSAIKRIEQFLLIPEVENVHQIESTHPNIEFNDVNIEMSTQSLRISLKFDKEGLILITGGLSVGKTILLKSILGEYPIRGSIKVDGKLSYASQEPWLFPSTIKQNIIFGEDFNQKRYEEILNICNLQYDIERFEKKDESIVTDRGVNLSKGQQARIGLARALYRRAAIYLIDDCLNSLDSKVGTEVFRKTVDFLKDKIVLIVTQNPTHFEYKPKKVLLVKDEEALLLDDYQTPKKISEKIDYLEPFPILQTPHEIETMKTDANEHEDTENDRLLNEINRNNIYHENIDIGSISFQTFKHYFKHCGGLLPFLVSVFFFISFATSDILSYKFVSIWVNQEESLIKYKNQSRSGTYESDEKYLDLLWKRNKFFIAYNITFALAIIFGFLRIIFHFYIMSKASISIHKKMIEAVVKAELIFFDTTLLGNIINRFSKDVYNLDENVPNLFFQVITMVLDLLFLLILTATMGWFFMILSIIVLLIVTFLLKYIYNPVTSHVKRLESAVHSAMVGYLNSSLEGLETIRVHGNENLLRKEFDLHQDKFSSAYILIIILARASGTTMDFLSYLLLASTYFYFFLKENITAADVGLILSTFARMFLKVSLANRQTVEFLSYLTSIERTINYTKIKTENNSGMELIEWPQKGSIRFSNIVLKYPSNHLEVLKGINIDVQDKEKIAIIGRTGSGKSSLISSLFRLYDFGGYILIDGVDIKSMSLNYRSKIGIIPQEPVIFSGSLRENLDPYQQISDEKLWKTLKKVRFDAKNLNESMKDLKLSTGQKQLICLVRILLTEKKIVILDEATSNMDLETERFICAVLKENLKNCTVLAIAHKLETIKDADRILVLRNGCLTTCRAPEKSVQNNE